MIVEYHEELLLSLTVIVTLVSDFIMAVQHDSQLLPSAESVGRLEVAVM